MSEESRVTSFDVTQFLKFGKRRQRKGAYLRKEVVLAACKTFDLCPHFNWFHFVVTALIGLVSNATDYSASKDELEPHAKLSLILSNFKAEHDSSGMIVAVAGMIIYSWVVEIEKQANAKTMSNVKYSLTEEEIRLLKDGIKKTPVKDIELRESKE
ncbi:hypothetical protein AAG906_003303 [Vitis piasezkii]